MAKRLLFFVIVAAALVTVIWLSQQRDVPLRVSGFIEADEIRVGSRVGGRVTKVHVAEGQQVAVGDTLLELGPFDLSERLSQAQALRAQAQATLDRLVAGFREEEIAQAKARVDQLQAYLQKLVNGPRRQEIDAAEAELQLAQSELELTKNRYQRAERLLGQQAVSQEEFDTATTNLRVAQAQVQVKTEALALLKEGTRAEEIAEAGAKLEEAKQQWQLQRNGYRVEDIAAARAAAEAAGAAEKAVRRQIDELQIAAPVNGTIEAVELQPGDLVAANAPVISIMDTSRFWVRAYVPENRLNLQIGQQVPITVDSYPSERFHGKITFVARQAEFTPRNVQTPEERSKQVFRIKVELLDGLEKLRPGMSADVWLDEVSPHE